MEGGHLVRCNGLGPHTESFQIHRLSSEQAVAQSVWKQQKKVTKTFGRAATSVRSYEGWAAVTYCYGAH